MASPGISFSMVLHNHQPVGNFEHVFAENHQQAYAPMLATLERHPGIRVGLHYSGALLEWLRAERPETIAAIGRLVDREQVELLGGGYYEPVLSALPDRDRVGQLRRMADELETLTGRRPRGAWLAERVWEPDLPTPLAAAGYDYTILDDAHLRAAGIPEDEHWGIYSTDDRGQRLLILPTEQGLRYLIPFRPVEDVIEHLRAHATPGRERVGIIGDDGEKFGGWPSTWELCWGQEDWVERFFTAVEASHDWLTMLRPSDAIERHDAIGRVHIPTSSYAEMGEWSLPPAARRDYTRALASAREEGRPEARWMRGGFWRGFTSRYTEIGALQTRMLRTSAKVAAMADGDGRSTAALDHLYRGQSNDCYWHGLFGGIYLSHLRHATSAQLIAAEDLADLAAGRVGTTATRVDADLDGRDEVLIEAPGQVLTIKPSAGGGIRTWDVRAARHDLTSVMRRRREAYHDAIDGAGDATAGEGMSIDRSMRSTEADLADRLWLDFHERHSGLVRLLPPGVGLDALERGGPVGLETLAAETYEIAAATSERVELASAGSDERPAIRVSIRPRGDRRTPGMTFSVDAANTGSRSLTGRLAVEWSIDMLGGGGNPQAWIRSAGQLRAFDSHGRHDDSDAVAMGNEWVGIELEQRASPGAAAWWYPIETVSISEHGFERSHQGTCLIWSWPLDLAPGDSMRVTIESDISLSRDHASDASGQTSESLAKEPRKAG